MQRDRGANQALDRSHLGLIATAAATRGRIRTDDAERHSPPVRDVTCDVTNDVTYCWPARRLIV